jgi:hypothetical protein
MKKVGLASGGGREPAPYKARVFASGVTPHPYTPQLPPRPVISQISLV